MPRVLTDLVNFLVLPTLLPVPLREQLDIMCFSLTCDRLQSFPHHQPVFSEEKSIEVILIRRPHSFGSLPFPDFGIVEVKRGRFASLFLRHHSDHHHLGAQVKRGVSKSAAAEAAGLLRFLLLHAVG